MSLLGLRAALPFLEGAGPAEENGIELNEYEVEVFRGIAGEGPMPEWGAWVGASIDFLQSVGLVKSTNRLTERGQHAIKNLEQFEGPNCRQYWRVK
jgi:hypothetical protein